nr:hypothetical protein [Tanacetum cinerariifolium]
MTHPNPQRHVVPTTVLTRFKLVPLTAARPVTTVVPHNNVTRPRPAKPVVTKPHSPLRRTINRSSSPKPSNFPLKITTVKASKVNAVKGVQENWIQVSYGLGPKETLTFLFLVHGNPQHALKDKGVINSGCSRHMIGNMSYLSDFEAINEGYVAFGGNPKGGNITKKGKIRIGNLDFDDVYFVKEIKFNLFSVSQMCDKKNNVLFTYTECIVLSSDFKLPDDNHETLNESNLWHRRLGHINFKTMNKPVKGNLVRGLPSKVFENNHTCVACKKGKQHRASCKTKPVIKKPKSAVYVSPSSCDKTKKHDDKTKRKAKDKRPVELSIEVKDLSDDFEEFSDNSTNGVNAACTTVTAVRPNSTDSTNTFSAAGPFNTAVSPTFGPDGKSSYADPS